MSKFYLVNVLIASVPDICILFTFFCIHTGYNVSSFFFLFSINNNGICQAKINKDPTSNADAEKTLAQFKVKRKH